jgi:hypothetical protein
MPTRISPVLDDPKRAGIENGRGQVIHRCSFDVMTTNFACLFKSGAPQPGICAREVTFQ